MLSAAVTSEPHPFRSLPLEALSLPCKTPCHGQLPQEQDERERKSAQPEWTFHVSLVRAHAVAPAAQQRCNICSMQLLGLLAVHVFMSIHCSYRSTPTFARTPVTRSSRPAHVEPELSAHDHGRPPLAE